MGYIDHFVDGGSIGRIRMVVSPRIEVAPSVATEHGLDIMLRHRAFAGTSMWTEWHSAASMRYGNVSAPGR